jgi:RNA polymerase sigma factor (TIGR02999 family)
MSTDPEQITVLLRLMREGDRNAMAQLVSSLYQQLRSIAGAYIAHERAGHTLQPTALVNEAFLKMVTQDIDWQNRAHFLGLCANVMRRVLVEYARTRSAQKRGGQIDRTELREDIAAIDAEAAHVLDLDAALNKLADFDERLARTVELRYFSGLTVEEAAEVLGVSAKTVKRDWAVAKAWLRDELLKGGYGQSESLGAS